jgi:hypothetical protein
LLVHSWHLLSFLFLLFLSRKERVARHGTKQRSFLFLRTPHYLHVTTQVKRAKRKACGSIEFDKCQLVNKKKIKQARHITATRQTKAYSICGHSPNSRLNDSSLLMRGSLLKKKKAGVWVKAAQLSPLSAYVSVRQHTSAYVSIRQHTSAYVKAAQLSLKLSVLCHSAN